MIVQAKLNDDGRRIDRVLRKMLRSMPLSLLYRLLRTGAIRLNGSRVTPDARLSEGDIILLPNTLTDKIVAPRTSNSRVLISENLAKPDLPALINNDQIFVINKPAGVSVAGPETEIPLPLSHRVEPMLAHQVPDSLSFRPVPVHRLDRICSGLLIYAKTIQAARKLTAMFRESRATKVYLALLERTVHRPELLQAPLSYDSTRRRAVLEPSAKLLSAYVQPISRVAGTTLSAISTNTGRRHQVRALCAQAGMPLAGDRRYGSPRSCRPFLHAWLLSSTDSFLLDTIKAGYIEAPPPSSRLSQHYTNWQQSADALRTLYSS